MQVAPPPTISEPNSSVAQADRPAPAGDGNAESTAAADGDLLATVAPGIKNPPKRKELRNIVFLSSEVAPWSKTGGLADVVGALPAALAARGHRVMVVTPRYASYKEAVFAGTTANINGATVGYYHCNIKGAPRQRPPRAACDDAAPAMQLPCLAAVPADFLPTWPP